MNTQVNNSVRTLGALVLIGLGTLFLVTNVFNIRLDIFSWGWPFFVILPGVACLAIALTGDRKTAGLIFPGVLVTGTGLILFAQNVTDYWESWAYIWAAYPAMVGIALMMHGRRVGKEKDVEAGRGLVNLGLILLLAFGAFFELLIFRDNDALTNVLLPILLIAAGGYLLLVRRRGGDDSAVGNGEKPKNDAAISPELKRKIDAALTEEQPM